jgi:hypothetical protein
VTSRRKCRGKLLARPAEVNGNSGWAGHPFPEIGGRAIAPEPDRQPAAGNRQPATGNRQPAMRTRNQETWTTDRANRHAAASRLRSTVGTAVVLRPMTGASAARHHDDHRIRSATRVDVDVEEARTIRRASPGFVDAALGAIALRLASVFSLPVAGCRLPVAGCRSPVSARSPGATAVTRLTDDAIAPGSEAFGVDRVPARRLHFTEARRPPRLPRHEVPASPKGARHATAQLAGHRPAHPGRLR